MNKINDLLDIKITVNKLIFEDIQRTFNKNPISAVIGYSRLETAIRYNLISKIDPWGEECHLGRFIAGHLLDFPEQ